MHAEAMDWLKRIKTLVWSRRMVCEFGSLNVNGSPREVYEADAQLYLGVDVRPGPGVDSVGNARDWSLGPRVQFDLVICTECLEHAEDAAAICANAHRLLKPGGIFLMTAAGVNRGPHSVNGDTLPEGEFYKNVSEADLRKWLAPFAVVLIQDREGVDIYSLAVKG